MTPSDPGPVRADRPPRRGQVFALAVAILLLVGCSASGEPAGVRAPTSTTAAGSPDEGDRDPATTSTAPDAGDDEPAWSDGDSAAVGRAVESSMTDLTSFRMVVSMQEDGEVVGVDVHIDIDGNCVGTFTIDGAVIDVVAAEYRAYIRGGADAWAAIADVGTEEGKRMAAFAAGRWVAMPVGPGLSTQMCDLDVMFDSIDDAFDGADLVLGEERDAGGMPTVVLDELDDGDVVSTMLVGFIDGRHLLLELEGSGDSDEFALAFSDFDRPVQVDEPVPADTIPLEDLLELP